MQYRILLSFAVLATVAVASAQTFPSLGSAADYGVFGVGNTKMTVSSGNTIQDGNYAVGSGSSLDFSGGGYIYGSLVSDPTARVNITGGSRTGSRVQQSLASAAADAINASSMASKLSPMFVLDSITNGTGLLSSVGGLTTFKVNNGLNLSGGHTLTLNGSANDYFVINMKGGYTTSGGSSVKLQGGVTADHVLWNFEGQGSDINFNGNSHNVGTFLAIDRNITDSGGTLTGSLIGGQNGQIKLQSGPHNTQATPEPVTLLLLGPAAAALAARRRKRSS